MNTADDDNTVAVAGADYVVLAGTDGRWQVVGRRTARTAELAVKACHTSDRAGCEFVAVPARSWRPVTVQARVETTLVVEAAEG